MAGVQIHDAINPKDDLGSPLSPILGAFFLTEVDHSPAPGKRGDHYTDRAGSPDVTEI